MFKEEIMAMSVKAYVNRAGNYVKIILGNDEYEIVVQGTTDAVNVKKSIRKGSFSMNDVKPANIDTNVVEIRARLKHLSEEIVRIYSEAERQEGFRAYDKDTCAKTDKLAYEITDILSNGISGNSEMEAN